MKEGVIERTLVTKYVPGDRVRIEHSLCTWEITAVSPDSDSRSRELIYTAELFGEKTKMTAQFTGSSILEK